MLCYLPAIPFISKAQGRATSIGQRVDNETDTNSWFGSWVRCVPELAKIRKSKSVPSSRRIASSYKIASLEVPFKMPETTRQRSR